MNAFKVLSFNLRRDFRHDKMNRWEHRKELATQVIKDSDACIIGVQELLPEMKQDITGLLSGYSILGLGRTKNLQNEHSAIILRNDDIEVYFDKTFWLSKTPEKSGSRALFAFFPRVCTVCEIYLRRFHQKIRVYNTHFDHISWPARTLGVRIILEYMHRYNQIEKLPSILMGDMNAHPNSKPIRILSQNLHNYKDIHLTNVYQYFKPSDISNTYHGFKGRMKSQPIDYIFVSDEFIVDQAKIDYTCINGKYPSDHYPLIATLRLKS